MADFEGLELNLRSHIHHSQKMYFTSEYRNQASLEENGRPDWVSQAYDLELEVLAQVVD